MPVTFDPVSNQLISFPAAAVGLPQPLDTTDSPTFAGISADTVSEKTADNGVVIDGATVKDGGASLTADLDLGTNSITSLAEPVNADDAATKNYVDVNAGVVTDNVRFRNLSSTALIDGGTVTINADNTKFDVAAGTAVYVDNYTDPLNPTYSVITFGPFTAQTLPDLANQDQTSVAIDNAGAIYLYFAEPGSALRRQIVNLGTCVHSSRTQIDVVADNTYTVGIDVASALFDLGIAVNIINKSGNVFGSNGANLTTTKTAGVTHLLGINFHGNKAVPNEYNSPELTTVGFHRTWRDGAGDFILLGAEETSFDPSYYDDGTGGTTNPNGVMQDHQYQIIRIMYRPDIDYIMYHYGTEPYPDLETAKKNIPVPFTPNPQASVFVYRGGFVVRGNATDLSDSEQAYFFEADKFGAFHSGRAVMSDGVSNMHKFANGCSVDDISSSVTSDGVNITYSIERRDVTLGDGGDIEFQFVDKNYRLDCTPPASINLTAGTDTVPQANYVYAELVTGNVQLNVSTTDFPSGIAKLAYIEALSATATQTDGIFIHQQTIDSIGSWQEGHLPHINAKFRSQPATWKSGGLLTPSTGITEFDVAIDPATIFQIHEYVSATFNTATGTPVYIVNDFDTPYKRVTDLTAELTDAVGGSLSGRRYSLVFYINVSENSADNKLLCNKPIGSYGTNSAADTDANRYTVYDIPQGMTSSSILIARVTVRHQTADGGTFTLISNQDLRGKLPSVIAGGGTPYITEFPDNLFKVIDSDDSTKELAFEVANVPTATIRTVDAEILGGANTQLANLRTNTKPTFNGVDAGSAAISSVADPSVATDAATKNYVDSRTHNTLASLQGGTAGEYYHLNNADYSNLTNANAQLGNLWTSTKPTFNGIDAGSAIITSVAEPSASTDAATKNYVDLKTHNSLVTLQGGAANEYYHLNNTDYGNLTDASAQLANLWTTGNPEFNTVGVGGTPAYDLHMIANNAIMALNGPDANNRSFIYCNGRLNLGDNIFYDGASFQVIDTGQGSMLFQLRHVERDFTVFYAPPGSTSPTAVMTLEGDTGNMGIGVASPNINYKLEISTNSAGKPGGGTWADSSDERIKRDIEKARDCLEIVSRLRPIKFNWKSPEIHEDRNKYKKYGFKAQDVEKVLPHLVNEINVRKEESKFVEGDKIKALNFDNGFFAILVGAMQEMNAEIADLKRRVAELEKNPK